MRWRAVAFVALALLVRWVSLGRYVTPDEPIWVMRSVRFADAIAAGDWAAIPQTGHPGVTTMAVGALGVRITTLLQPQASAAHLDWIRNLAWLAPENAAAFPHLTFFLPAGRILVMLLSATGIAGAYTLARTRLGERTARLLALFLALDPFLGGLSGLLHTDALQATFVLLATLYVLPQRGSPTVSLPALGASALSLALAGMTKTLGLLAAPGLAIAMLLFAKDALWRRVLRVAALTLMTVAFLLALYPPFWSDPQGALATLIGAASYHEGIGLRNVFFLGQMTAHPGPGFYPLVLLFRSTPAVLLGLLLALRPGKSETRHKLSLMTLGRLLLPTLIYLVVLTSAGKKFDRYVLSVIPLLSVIAAVAWAPKITSARGPLRSSTLLALLLWPWALVAPLPLYYADPLLGGPWLARQLIPLGWGENVGISSTLAARALNTETAHTLLTPNVPGSAPFFHGDVFTADSSREPCADVLLKSGAEVPPSGDYALVAAPQLAGIPLGAVYAQQDTFATDEPLLAPGHLPGAPSGAEAPNAGPAALHAWLEERFAVGDTFAWLHAPDCYPIQNAQLEELLHAAVTAGALTCESAAAKAGLMMERCTLLAPWPAVDNFKGRFAHTLDLIAAAWPAQTQAPAALTVRLRWQALQPLADLEIYLALEDAQGLVWAEGGNTLVDERTWSTSHWETGNFVEGDAYIPLPLTVPPGTYTLTISLFDDAKSQLGMWRPDMAFGGTRLVLGQVELQHPPYPAAELKNLNQSTATSFPGLHLLGSAILADEIWAGEALRFDLGWERHDGTPINTLPWQLTCESGQQYSGTLKLAPSDPQSWHLGHRYLTHHILPSDPMLAGGPCALSIQASETATPVVLGTFQVLARARRFELSTTPPLPLSVSVGNFGQLLGAKTPLELSPGDTISPTFYLRATAPADRDYTLFVHLIAPTGNTPAQSDGWPERGAAPTSTWVAEQIIEDQHVLRLPEDASSGDYQLFLGLYDVESGGRVPLYDAAGARLPDDRVLVAEIKVTP